LTCDFFEKIKSIVPWMTPREASVALNDVEFSLFAAHPEYLDLPEDQQNVIVIQEFLKSHYVRRH
jgi:hypothetical protein